MNPLVPPVVEALTFDCYGTLIDWHGGIRASLRALPGLAGADLERLVADREREDLELVRGSYRPYGEVLALSLRAAAARQRRQLEEGELLRFAHSMAEWPPFDDALEALPRLAARFRLAILSNVERATLEASVGVLGAPFELLVTAQDVRSYKPAVRHFEKALSLLRLPRERVLHVAGSPVHDLVPARGLGWRSVWVNRLDEPEPTDLPGQPAVADLAELARALE